MPAPTSNTWRAIGSASWATATPSRAIIETMRTATTRISRQRTYATPSRKCRNTPLVLVRSNGRAWIMNSTPIGSRNENAFSPNAHDGPSVASTIPASAGPNARAPVNDIELSRTALNIASLGTSCGTNDCHAAIVRPEPTPLTITQASTRAVVAVPVDQSAQSAAAIAIMRPCDQMSTIRRSWRSAREPPSGLTSVAGKNAQKALTPTHAVEWVSWSTTYGTVTVCIHVPVLETSAADQKMRKSRYRNAASGPSDSAACATTVESTCPALGGFGVWSNVCS